MIIQGKLKTGCFKRKKARSWFQGKHLHVFACIHLLHFLKMLLYQSVVFVKKMTVYFLKLLVFIRLRILPQEKYKIDTISI